MYARITLFSYQFWHLYLHPCTAPIWINKGKRIKIQEKHYPLRSDPFSSLVLGSGYLKSLLETSGQIITIDFFWRLSSGYSCSICSYTNTHQHHTHAHLTHTTRTPITIHRLEDASLKRSPETSLCRQWAHRNTLQLHTLRGCSGILFLGKTPVSTHTKRGSNSGGQHRTLWLCQLR
jgi:hypothetical protein